MQSYLQQILRAEMDHFFNEFIKKPIWISVKQNYFPSHTIVNGKRKRIQHTASRKGEKLDVTEHGYEEPCRNVT